MAKAGETTVKTHGHAAESEKIISGKLPIMPGLMSGIWITMLRNWTINKVTKINQRPLPKLLIENIFEISWTCCFLCF
jgi:hypothetical protein